MTSDPLNDLASGPMNLASKLREQLRLTEVLFDQTIIGAVTASPDYRIQKVNRAATTLLHYPSPDVLCGLDLNILLTDSSAGGFREQISTLVAREGPSIDHKCQFRTRSGSPVWVRYKLTSILGENEEITAIVIFFWDYSKEKEMEEKILDLNQWLEREVAVKTVKIKEKNDELEIALAKVNSLDHTKTEFLKIVGHEIRTPLNGIMGATWLLKEMIRTNEQGEFFEMLQVSLRRLELFTITALQIAELQTMQNRMVKNPEKISEILDDLAAISVAVGFDFYQRPFDRYRRCGHRIAEPLFPPGYRRRASSLFGRLGEVEPGLSSGYFDGKGCHATAPFLLIHSKNRIYKRNQRRIHRSCQHQDPHGVGSDGYPRFHRFRSGCQILPGIPGHEFNRKRDHLFSNHRVPAFGGAAGIRELHLCHPDHYPLRFQEICLVRRGGLLQL
jgi:PAS domain S-box-containing protein